MTTQDLHDAIDRHGGDLERWPDPIAARARIAERDDPAFAAALAEARALDRALVEAVAAEPLPPGYVTRVVARATANRLPRWLSPRVALPFAAALAGVSVVAGVAAANVLAVVDPDLLSIAELALGAGGFVLGN